MEVSALSRGQVERPSEKASMNKLNSYCISKCYQQESVSRSLLTAQGRGDSSNEECTCLEERKRRGHPRNREDPEMEVISVEEDVAEGIKHCSFSDGQCFKIKLKGKYD